MKKTIREKLQERSRTRDVALHEMHADRRRRATRRSRRATRNRTATVNTLLMGGIIARGRAADARLGALDGTEQKKIIEHEERSPREGKPCAHARSARASTSSTPRASTSP
jgi:hypothetical protein